MGSTNIGEIVTAAFVTVAPQNVETVRGSDGCAMASDRE